MTTDQIDNALARIARKLASVREADPDRVLYGASRHQYRLNPCLDESAVAAFENRIGVTLPPEYRSFVRQLGNGGAGRYNGLHALDVDKPERYASLRRPFPVSAKLARQLVARPEQERFLEGFEDDELAGCLETADSGCGTFSFLVVAGEQRGTMWGSGGMCELIPYVGERGEQMGFLTWYEGWLDHCLNPGVIAYHARLTK